MTQVLEAPTTTASAPRPTAATATVIRSAVESTELDALVAVGLALHLFTELADRHTKVGQTDLHRATTVLTKQISEALARHSANEGREQEALRSVLRLVTDPNREALPDGRTASQLCGAAWPSVRTDAYTRAEQSIRGAADFGVVPMLRLAATRAIVHQAPWWGTPEWRSRLARYVSRNDVTPVEHLTLGSAPEFASDTALLAIVR